MNQMILMASVQSEPEMRFTPDNLAVSSMLVSFAASKSEDPPFQMRVSAFGDLAQTIVDTCHVGTQVVMEGQLHMNVIERDGKNEKRAELTLRRVYQLGSGTLDSLNAGPAPESISTSGSVVTSPQVAATPAPPDPARTRPSSEPVSASRPPAKSEPNFDDIPF